MEENINNQGQSCIIIFIENIECFFSFQGSNKITQVKGVDSINFTHDLRDLEQQVKYKILIK